jgi:hypothetical protein
MKPAIADAAGFIWPQRMSLVECSFVAGSIEIHYDPARGALSLSCGEEAFVPIRDAVIAEGRVAEVLGAPPGDLQLIMMTVAPATKPRSHEGLALLGCALISLVLISVFSVGVATILGSLK